MEDILQKQRELLALCRLDAESPEVKAALLGLCSISNYQPWGLIVNGDPSLWYRARSFGPGEPTANNLFDLIYRSAPATGAGRANMEGQRVFYAAWNAATAIAEVGPLAGGRVQCIACRARPDASYQASLIGVFEQHYMSGRSMYPSSKLDFEIAKYISETSPREMNRRLMVDSFLSSLLRQPDASAYSITSVVADLIYEICDMPGFIYPSVKAHGAANLAVPDYVFDRCFEVTAAATFEVIGNYQYGVCDTRRISQSTKFSAAGDIDWSPIAELPPWAVPSPIWTPLPKSAFQADRRAAP